MRHRSMPRKDERTQPEDSRSMRITRILGLQILVALWGQWAHLWWLALREARLVFSFAGGTGLSQGRERLEAARAAGQEISQEQEDLGMLLHGFTGLSEMWPVGNILKRIPADVDDLLKNKIVKRIKEIVSSGVFESIQEQSAGIAHDAIEANVYNPDLNVEDSLYGKIVDLDPSAFGDIFTSRGGHSFCCCWFFFRLRSRFV